jgi:hypothetical protein
MMHKGQQFEREAERLEREANSTLDEKRRAQLRSLANDLRKQKRDWMRPRA